MAIIKSTRIIKLLPVYNENLLPEVYKFEGEDLFTTLESREVAYAGLSSDVSRNGTKSLKVVHTQYGTIPIKVYPEEILDFSFNVNKTGNYFIQFSTLLIFDDKEKVQGKVLICEINETGEIINTAYEIEFSIREPSEYFHTPNKFEINFAKIILSSTKDYVILFEFIPNPTFSRDMVIYFDNLKLEYLDNVNQDIPSIYGF